MRLDDPKGITYLRKAAENPEYVRLWWLYFLMHADDAVRQHPEFVALQNALGYTPEHRYWLCQQVSKLPENLGISCDPEKYRVTRYLSYSLCISLSC